MLYTNCCMEEERQSLPSEAKENTHSSRHGEDENAPFGSLIETLRLEKQRTLKLPDVSTVYRMLVDLGSETSGHIPPELHETIRNVSIGFGFLAFDQLPDGNKAAFIHRILREQKYRNRDHLLLTPQQAEILHRIASTMNIAYDPGQQEDDTQRNFPYADVKNACLMALYSMSHNVQPGVTQHTFGKVFEE